MSYLVGIIAFLALFTINVFRDGRRGANEMSKSLAAIAQSLRSRLRSAMAAISSRFRRQPHIEVTKLPAAPMQAAEVSLSARLRKLEAAFTPVAENASHPREFCDAAEFNEAVELLAAEATSLQIAMEYALGANWGLQCAALKALAQRADRAEALGEIMAAFERLNAWAMFFALNYFLTLEPLPTAGEPALGAKEWWRDSPLVLLIFREYFSHYQDRTALFSFGGKLSSLAPACLAQVRLLLERIRHPVAEALLLELQKHESTLVDRAFLTSFGRFWAGARKTEIVVAPEAWRSSMLDAETSLCEAPFRSLLLMGEAGVGKTSFLKLFAGRLEKEGWTVFEAGAPDLMADQQWFGQLEGRIQKALGELSASKKLIWYVPDLLQLALSGTHQGQAAGILDQIFPAVSSGRLVIWSEATPASATRLLRIRPALRNILDIIRLDPLAPEATLSLTESWARELSKEDALAIEAETLEVALDAARQYLTATRFPGSAFDLLKTAVDRVSKAGVSRVEPGDIFQSLSQMTGLPVSILNNRERIDLAAVRTYFAQRIMGQDEAISAIVDRIAMLKAGLNDPGKPIGVFLFAGPTGTGKTELAKTTAEFLFGSPDRMIRLDMSEFQSPESIYKILGGGEADSLVNRVRKQPFSVVLLDEFEKAHANIWDLFLQVFDDARLTDTIGHEADFRHCIIILTTNLGATSHRGAELGFLPPASEFTGDQILRAISQTFRPEFQNRLDKVIVFQPLSRDLMRGILKKELARVLERRGFKDREWAIEWEESALEFLLEKGFSPEMGARPLKRAIDQYLIAPLAAAIVEKRFPEGDQFVFIRSNGRAIQAEFVDPDADETEKAEPADLTPTDKKPSLPAMIMGPKGMPEELEALEIEVKKLQEVFSSARWEARKEELAQAMHGDDFWKKPDRHAVLSQFALMDRVKAAADTAEALGHRLLKGKQEGGKYSRELIERLARQLFVAEEGVKDVFEAAPVEAALAVEPALTGHEPLQEAENWRRRLYDMYRNWAAARRMQWKEIIGQRAKTQPVLLVSGFGAHRILSGENGLHLLEIPGENGGIERIAARIRVAATPAAEPPSNRLYAALKEALETCPPSNKVVRRYRMGPSPLVRDERGWRTRKLDAVLRGDFDLLAEI